MISKKVIWQHNETGITTTTDGESPGPRWFKIPTENTESFWVSLYRLFINKKPNELNMMTMDKQDYDTLWDIINEIDELANMSNSVVHNKLHDVSAKLRRVRDNMY